MEYQKPKELLNPKKNLAEYQASQINKKGFWEYLIIIIAILSFSYSVYSTERMYTKDKEINELKDIIKNLKEEKILFDNSIYLQTVKHTSNKP